MGTAKYALRLGSETLLQRICRIVSESTGSVVVVAAPGQSLPKLAEQIVVIRDELPDQGPLAGIVRGLSFLQSGTDCSNVDRVFVTACDAPLLLPEVVTLLLNSLADADAVAVRDSGRLHPLCAAYSTKTLATAVRLLAAGERRPRVLLESVQTRILETDELRSVDPKLSSLVNVNTPEEFQTLVQSMNEGPAQA
jgi:molybdenum cofactor guanylyltransferase